MSVTSCTYCGGVIDHREVVRSVVGDREVLVRWAFCPNCQDAAVEGYAIRPIQADGDGLEMPFQLRRAVR